jgi:hypothetical protein
MMMFQRASLFSMYLRPSATSILKRSLFLMPKYLIASSTTAGSSSTAVISMAGRCLCRYQAVRPPPNPISSMLSSPLA